MPNKEQDSTVDNTVEEDTLIDTDNAVSTWDMFSTPVNYDIFQNGTSFNDTDNDYSGSKLTLPNTSLEGIIKAQEVINEVINDDKELNPPEKIYGLTLAATALNTNEVLGVPGTTEEFLLPKKESSLSSLTLGNVPAGVKLDSDNRALSITNTLGVGNKKKLPLYDSGFYIYLSPIDDVDISMLKREIANQVLEFGYDTAGLAYTHDRYGIDRIIVDFIIAHADATSLDCPLEDLHKYISLYSVSTLITGIMAYMAPDEFPIIIPCSNVLDEEHKCTYIREASVSAASLLRVNGDRMTPYMRSIMARRDPGSVSIDEVIRYREEYDSVSSDSFTINGVNGDLKFGFKVPMVDEASTDFNFWVEYISTKLVEWTDDSPEEDKDRRASINKILNSVSLSSISSFITTIDNGQVEESDRSKIIELLGTLSGYTEISEKITSGYKDSIIESVLTVMGVPVYKCPTCGDIPNGKEHFEDVRAIGDLQSFLSLGR